MSSDVLLTYWGNCNSVSVRPEPLSGDGVVRNLTSGVGLARDDVNGSLFFHSIFIH